MNNSGAPATHRNSAQDKALPVVATIFALVVVSLSGRVFADALPSNREAKVPVVTASVAAPSLIMPTAIIGSINIENASIFDLDDPQENKLLFRLANRAHAQTRPSVIQNQLLFKSGDPFSARVLEESERILRSNRYIQEAIIEPAAMDNGVVDINVRTTDVWTLLPKVSLSRSGGENHSGIGLKEMNLLGTGMQVEAMYKSGVDRDSKILKFSDHNLGDSWYSLNAIYANNSDGHAYVLDFGKPFYSMESTSAHGVSILDVEQIDSLYDRGEIAAQYRNTARNIELFKGWSSGLRDGWTRRYTTGLAYDVHRFAGIDATSATSSIVPRDRTFVYPFVGIEFMQDRFEKTENQDQIKRTEDRYLGTRFVAKLGLAQSSFGSDRDAWMISAGAQTGFGSSQKNSLIISSNLATRIEQNVAQNLRADVAAKYYRRQSDKRLFYAGLTGTYGHNLDIDNQLLLGGDSGLRGYPLRYQTGNKSALLTLEQRYFTDWYPFRLFRVGGAVFFDAGRAWGENLISRQTNKILKNVGLGLRIGNSRSGEGRMTHIDFAFPLDGDRSIRNFQFLIETKKSF